MDATKHQPAVPSQDTGFAKDPAANTSDVVYDGNVDAIPNATRLENMPYKDGQ